MSDSGQGPWSEGQGEQGWGAPQPGQGQWNQPPGYGGGGGAPMAKPSNNLVMAIVVTLLCCLPAGVVSIVYAAQVDGKWNSGDYQGAQQAAKNARTWAFVSIGAGAVAILVWIALIAAGGISTTTY
jgi:hypothetical protein